MIKVIYKIAKAELQMLFYSPIAWIILGIFTIQSAFIFTDAFQGIVDVQARGYSRSGITSMIFGYRGMFGTVMKSLYFYIPLLTMSLVGKEITSGSIKLLYSSPLTNFQIIMGKFGSMMLYGGIMMGVQLLFAVFAMITVKDFDMPFVLSGILGLYFLMCAYSAIGIFMSSISSYQIVAAIGTFAILFGLNIVGNYWQQYDVVREITYWLSITGRGKQFVNGLICSEDVLYFLSVISLFIALTIIRLNAVRQKIKYYITFGRNLIVIAIVCVIAFFSSQPALKWYYDASETDFNTLTKVSQDIVSKMEGDLTITSYINVLERDSRFANYRFLMPDRKRFEQYLRFKPEMKLKYVYYFDISAYPEMKEWYPNLTERQIMGKKCRSLKLDSAKILSKEEVRKIVNLNPEGNTFVRQIERGNGQKAWLRIFNDFKKYPSEQEISVAFKRMIMDLPKVGFLTGHGERSYKDNRDRGYTTFANSNHFRYSLINQGFNVEDVSLVKGIPSYINIMMISDMRKAFSKQEEEELQKYIDRGGNLFVLAEPKRKAVMEPVLKKYFGYEMTEGVLVKRDTNFLADIVPSHPTKEAGKFSHYLRKMLWYDNVLSTPSCAGLKKVADKGYNAITLFKTDTTTWNEVETTDFIDDTIRLNPNVGEVQQSYPTVLALSRKMGDKEQKIILTSDADCISTGEFMGRRGMSCSNYSLITSSFFWLSDHEAPLDVRRPRMPDNKVYLSKTGAKVTKASFNIFLPLLILCLGIFLLLRRKSR